MFSEHTGKGHNLWVKYIDEPIQREECLSCQIVYVKMGVAILLTSIPTTPNMHTFTSLESCKLLCQPTSKIMNHQNVPNLIWAI